jgi:hypothetical protein
MDKKYLNACNNIFLVANYHVSILLNENVLFHFISVYLWWGMFVVIIYFAVMIHLFSFVYL